jgi:hypothetical protein
MSSERGHKSRGVGSYHMKILMMSNYLLASPQENNITVCVYKFQKEGVENH